jgi:transcriptional regulator with XRE-family HTH domain
MIKFEEHLKNIRKSKKLTQKQVAQGVNVSERAYQSYELGESKPAFDVLLALADFFDVSIDYLVGRDRTAR